MSGVEAVVNLAVGYLVAVAATFLILPAFGYPVSGSDAFGISALFTVVSLVRSYVLRRVFSGLGR